MCFDTVVLTFVFVYIYAVVIVALTFVVVYRVAGIVSCPTAVYEAYMDYDDLAVVVYARGDGGGSGLVDWGVAFVAVVLVLVALSVLVVTILVQVRSVMESCSAR